MSLEAIYPIVISIYSLTVTAMAVVLWWKTQTHIARTKVGIETQVANAVKDISNKVDEKLDFEVPEFDYEAVSAPLMARLDKLENDFPNIVGNHVSMAIKGVQATEGKQIAAYVESLGIEGITDEAKEAAIERLSTKQRLAYQLMTMKVPPRAKKEHPASTFVFEQGRGLAAQLLIESDDNERGTVRVENKSGSSGFGVR